MIRFNYDPSKPLRYVTYGRMSDPGQNPRSPDQQFDTIANELRRCGYDHWVHVEDFRDDGVSGRYQRKRAGYQEMLQKIRTGVLQVDAILVDMMDRLGRMDDLPTIQRELLHQHGVLVLTADTRFADPTGQAGRAMQFVQNLQATEEGRVKAHRVLRGKRDAAKRGHWPGGPPPLGYRLSSVMKNKGSGPAEVDYRILEPDPPSASLVREIYRLAREKGWGGHRIAKHLNAQAPLVKQFGRFRVASICRILSAPIYSGELVFNRVATDVINDRRVTRLNDESEHIRVPGFCEAIIGPDEWEEVQRIRRPRSEAAKKIAQRREAMPGKNVQPLDPGTVLKYPLTGLVRCGVCGASMSVNSSGTLGANGKRYAYRVCPTALAGACPNKFHVPEDWLWKAVIARLRARLFPSPSTGQCTASEVTEVPDWVPELFAEVQAEWQRLRREDGDRRPRWQQELSDLDKNISGWIQSLSNPDLPAPARQLVERRVEESSNRKSQIEGQLSALDREEEQLNEALDPKAVLQALGRLDQVLASGNASATNVELSLHIDRIEVHPDRRVVMHTCRLGVMEGLVEVLSRPAGNAPPGGVDKPLDPSITRIKPRRLGRRRVAAPLANGSTSAKPPLDVQDVDRFAGLSSLWFWEDCIEFPLRRSWPETQAEEVLLLKREKGWSQAKIARHFGKSSPTIRKALQIARERESAG